MAMSNRLEDAKLAYDVALKNEAMWRGLYNACPDDATIYSRWLAAISETTRKSDALARACDAEAAADYSGHGGVR